MTCYVTSVDGRWAEVSNWRTQWFELAADPKLWRYAARSLFDPTLYLMDYLPIAGLMGWYQTAGLNPDLPWSQGQVFDVTPGGRFPYGQAVEPDS